jgi:hypothetical protein
MIQIISYANCNIQFFFSALKEKVESFYLKTVRNELYRQATSMFTILPQLPPPIGIFQYW